MKRMYIYWKLQLKILFQMLGRMLGSSILLVICLGLFVYAGIKLNEEDTSTTKSVVALVVDDSSPLMDFALKYLESSESLEEFCTFLVTTPDKAEELLKEKQVLASIYFPEHFAEDIVSGKNTPATITLSQTSGVSQMLFRELTSAAARILSAAQANIYTFDILYDTYDFTQSKNEIYDYVNQNTLSMALNRANLFQTRTLTSTGLSISPPEFYIITAIVLFFLFFGMGLSSFFFSESNSFEIIMSTKKLTVTKRLFGKTIALFLLFLVVGIILFTIGGLTELLPWQCLFTLPWLALFISVWNLFIHELAGTKTNSILLLFLSGFLSTLASGCIIPAAFLPHPVIGIGKWLPTYFIHQIIKNDFTGDCTWNYKWILFTYTAILLFFTYFLKKCKERKVTTP